ncbi:MAG: response regulator [Niastella sp.]|nr:response regulator [Niastella sp.]
MDTIRFKILAVDDDSDDRFLLDQAFIQIVYESELKKFMDSDYLLSYLSKIEKSQYPSLIVLDNSLPKKSAAETLVQLKESPATKHIPVVIFSTLISPQKKKDLMALGALACVAKGTAMSELVEIAKAFKAIAEGNSSGNELLQLAV